MIILRRYLWLAILLLTFITYGSALAQTRPFQIALVTPIQIFPESDTIAGPRIDIIYGRNATVNGFDWGLVNHTTSGISSGIQMGFINMSDAVMHGEQAAFVNVAKGDIEGMQWGFVNYSNRSHGFQAGFFNYSHRTHGFQVGVINYARSITGLQLGLLNIIGQGGQFPVFPILNWSF